MSVPGLEVGFFIIVLGVLTYLVVWGKKDDDTIFIDLSAVSVRRPGKVATSAKAVRTWGKILVLAGAIVSIVSLL